MVSFHAHPYKNILQKVVRGTPPAGWDVTHVVGDGREDAELGIQIPVNRHDGRNVATAVTVVGRGPHRDDRVLWEVVLRYTLVDLPRDQSHGQFK